MPDEAKTKQILAQADELFKIKLGIIHEILGSRFEKYEKLAKITSPSDVLRSGVVYAVTKYWFLASYELHVSSSTERKKNISEKIKAARKHMLLIDDAKEATVDNPTLHAPLQDISYKALVEWWLLWKQKNAQAKLPRGRLRREAAETFVRDIGRAYTLASGFPPTIINNKDNYTGAFADLLSIVHTDSCVIIDKIDKRLKMRTSGAIIRYAKSLKLTGNVPKNAKRYVRSKNRSLAD